MPISFTTTEKGSHLVPISMENLKFHKFPFTLFLILPIQFSSLMLLSTGYTLPDQYFINCGSENSVVFGKKSFVGDRSFCVGPSNATKNSSSSADTSIYQTARVFYGHKSLYQFDINLTGTYMVRLHFFVFSSPYDLANALFDVRACGFSLLSNFSLPQSSDSPVIKEFLLTVEVGKFIIHFIPSHESSLAFVNAIEIFLAPQSFIPDQATHITSTVSNGNHSGLLSQALHTIYRINVGGSKLTPDNDTLLRTWIPDDEFLFYPGTAKNGSRDGWLTYQDRLATEYVAPKLVYKTAKELNTNQTGQPKFSNITWGFKVSKNYEYFVRVHFYDIVSPSPDVLRFYLQIYSNFRQEIRPYNITRSTPSPFYFDFIVHSDESGFMNVSVGLHNESLTQNAFLNGLEIMEIMRKSERRLKRNGQSIMAGSLGFGAFILISIVLLLAVFKRKRIKSKQTYAKPFSMPLFGGSFHNRLTERTADTSLAPNLNLGLKIPYVEIQRATKNFSSKLLIGEGGFGKVYEGTLHDGAKVAVKRSEPGHGQGLKEFQTEIMVLSQIRHRHLVSLIGYCDEGSEMILVYEFMEKGTLRDHLYVSDCNSERSSTKSSLSWEERLKICIDAAEGLHYLHTGLAKRIIHCDVKSTNILLSEDYIAKVADFGLSKSGPPDPDHDITGVKGSFGYLDPEYFMSLQLTEKSDVYSFGVVLLEVLCARPAVIDSDERDEVNLAEWGMLWQKKSQLEKIVDPVLVGNINSRSLRKFGEIAERCLRTSGGERPVMREVLWDLQFALRLQQTAMHREPHEDSTINASAEFALQGGHRLPSHLFPDEENDPAPGGDDGSVTMATGVFSQLRTSCGR